jgi:hypothetical protein
MRSGKRTILAPQDAEDFFLSQTAYQNGPTPYVRRRTERVQAALTKVDKGPGHTSSLEELDESVHRVTLANTTEIQARPCGQFDPAVGKYVKGGTWDVRGHPG